MKTTSTTTKSTKQVQIIAHYEIKKDHSFRPLVGHVAYLIRSSDGQSEYCCTLINGKASGCTCPARKPCYHMKQLEAREAERVTKSVSKVSALCPVDDSIVPTECPIDATAIPEEVMVASRDHLQIGDRLPVEDGTVYEVIEEARVLHVGTGDMWQTRAKLVEDEELTSEPLTREQYVALFSPNYEGSAHYLV